MRTGNLRASTEARSDREDLAFDERDMHERTEK